MRVVDCSALLVLVVAGCARPSPSARAPATPAAVRLPIPPSETAGARTSEPQSAISEVPAPEPPAAAAGVAPAALPPHGLATGSGDPADLALAEGDRAYAADDLTAARDAYRRAEQLRAKSAAPKLGLLRVLLAETEIPTEFAAAPKDPRLQSLLKKLDAIEKLDPTFGPAALERGRILLMLGQGDRALEALRRAVSLVPLDPETHSALGVALLATGNVQHALGPLKRAVELDPGSAERLRGLGAAELILGHVAEAISAYRRAVSLIPEDARARGDLGAAYLAAGYVDHALVELGRAARLDPARAGFRSNMAYAALLKGDLDRAEQEAEQAIRLDPKLGSGFINLGLVLAKRGEYVKAKIAFQRALDLDPEDPRAKDNLRELEEQAKQKPH